MSRSSHFKICKAGLTEYTNRDTRLKMHIYSGAADIFQMLSLRFCSQHSFQFSLLTRVHTYSFKANQTKTDGYLHCKIEHRFCLYFDKSLPSRKLIKMCISMLLRSTLQNTNSVHNEPFREHGRRLLQVLPETSRQLLVEAPRPNLIQIRSVVADMR